MEREDFLNSVEEKDERLEALKQLYPEIFSDGKINLDAFKDATGTSDLPEGEDKTPGYYGLYWPGKRAAKQLAKKTATGTLEPVPGQGVDEDTTHNIYIEGDNLEVLRTLRNSYRGRVKMIYIDPPYNTGNDFVYPDDFSMPLEEYLKLTGQIDEKGKKLVANPKTSGAFHRNWLNMMYPRLSLARDLLQDDGIIFISIDDNEQANLKLLCDDVFGEENFVTILHVEMSATQGMKVKAAQNGNIVKNAEYILIYSKDGHRNIATTLLYDYRPNFDGHYSKMIQNDQLVNLKDQFLESYPNEKISNITDAYRENGIFRQYVNDNVANIFADDKISGYEPKDYPEGKVYEVEGEDRKYYIYNNGQKIRQLLPLAASFGACDDFDNSYGLRKIRGDWWKDFYRDMGNVSKEGDVVFANGKKPIRLIKQLCKMCTSEGDLILDFFSGSGTTAHALLELNSEAEIKDRKFIMIQLPIDVNEEIGSDYGDLKTICDIGENRIKNASTDIKEKLKAENKDLKNFDLGFKVYKLIESNFTKFKPVMGQNKEALNELYTSLGAMVDPLIDGWKPENVLEEIKLRQGFALDCQMEELKEVTSNKVWHLTDPARPITLYVCLDEKIEQKTVDSLNIGKDDKFICLNSAIDDTTYARLADKERVQTL